MFPVKVRFLIFGWATLCLLAFGCSDAPPAAVETAEPADTSGETPTKVAADTVLLASATDTVVSSLQEAAQRVREEAEEKKEVPEPEVKKEVKKKRKRGKARFNETVHQFGTIKQGDVVKHSFPFKNTGDAPLHIKNVEVSCGCTFPSYPFIPLEPGEEGIIEVSFDSKGKIGRQKPTVTVITNGRPRIQKLYLEGFVE